jgi:hypothetical protein
MPFFWFAVDPSQAFKVKLVKHFNMGLAVRSLQLAVLSGAASFFVGCCGWYVAGGFFLFTIGNMVYNFTTKKPNPPASPPVPEGKLRICVTGMTHSGPTAKAHYLADKIAKRFPDKYETWYYFDMYTFYKYIVPRFANAVFPAHLKGHSTSPFVWFETGKDNKEQYIGGAAELSKWAIETFPNEPEIVALAKENWISLKPYITGQSYHCDNGVPVPPATCGGKKSL